VNVDQLRAGLEAVLMDHTNDAADPSCIIRRVDDGVLFIAGEINLDGFAEALSKHLSEGTTE